MEVEVEAEGGEETSRCQPELKKKTVPVSGEFAAPQEKDVWFSDHVIKVHFAIKDFFILL